MPEKEKKKREKDRRIVVRSRSERIISGETLREGYPDGPRACLSRSKSTESANTGGTRLRARGPNDAVRARDARELLKQKLPNEGRMLGRFGYELREWIAGKTFASWASYVSLRPFRTFLRLVDENFAPILLVISPLVLGRKASGAPTVLNRYGSYASSDRQEASEAIRQSEAFGYRTKSACLLFNRYRYFNYYSSFVTFQPRIKIS